MQIQNIEQKYFSKKMSLAMLLLMDYLKREENLFYYASKEFLIQIQRQMGLMRQLKLFVKLTCQIKSGTAY